MFTRFGTTLVAGAILALASTAAASAAQLWPGSVVGVWNAQANQSSLTITISSQSASGKCREIAGTILDNASGVSANLEGFYCPSSGRVHFTRSDPTSGFTYQDYTGNLSDGGRTLYMGGTFAADDVGGEYAFFAAK